jgi:hypothetical protein
VTRRPGVFVIRTDEILLAASGWVLRASAGKVVQDLPPVWKFFKRLLRIKTTNAVAKRTVSFHDGVTIEFTVRVIDDLAATGVFTSIGCAARGFRLDTVTRATSAIITAANIQRAIVIKHLPS